MEILLGLGFFLLVVMFVGHGLWLFVAFIFRSLSDPQTVSRPVTPDAPKRHACGKCGSVYAATFRSCPVCGAPAQIAPKLSPQERLRKLQQQLDALLAEKAVTAEQFESARSIFQSAMDRLNQPLADKSREQVEDALPVFDTDVAALRSISEVYSSRTEARSLHLPQGCVRRRAQWHSASFLTP